MKTIIKVLWIILVSFSITIHNVTILPTLSKNIQFWMTVATIGINLCMIYFVFYYQTRELEKIKKEIKKKKC